ncbi:MAG: alpha-glucan family phosphorylase, partial [Actinoallomurus sp.]
PDEELFEAHRRRKRRLVQFVRARQVDSATRRQAPAAEIRRAGEVLDPNAFTIGFARRFATYKRATLIFRDMERLKKILCNPDRPVQIIIAGKAHPADEGGKRLIQDIVRFTDDPAVRHRIVFLPDYDMALGQSLVQGCDVWMNNPLRPLEACGTSGMKVALNGGLNLSILDGWWDEWYDGNNGWSIPSADRAADPDRRDDIEAGALYELIEDHVAALFYDRATDGLPRRWLEMVKHTLASLGPKVLAGRMVRDYVHALYTPAALSGRRLAAENHAAAKALASWKLRVAKLWQGVTVEHVESSGVGQSPQLGAPLTVRATVELAGLEPSDVAVEVVYGRVSETDTLVDPSYLELTQVEGADGGKLRYAGEVRLDRPGAFGYSVRVVPKHELFASRAEMGLVALPPAPTGMTNGDLR